MTKGHHGEDQVGFVDPSAKKGNCCSGLVSSLGGLCRFIYNPQTHLVMGRSGKQWAQLIAFYIVFYACLIGFWVACLTGFLATTNISMPTLLGFQSMLQLNPAIGYRPQPDFESNLIKFNASDPQSFNGSADSYLADLNAFLAPYFNETRQNQLVNCDGTGLAANKTAACQFRPKVVAPECFPEATAPYGLRFADGTPCIVLKMNRIIGWLPNVNDTNGAYQNVKMRCIGENAADNETIGYIKFMPGGEDAYGPFGEISASYFPYMNQPDYLSPLVFARFISIRKYTVVLIWCSFDSVPMNFVRDAYQPSSLLMERSGGAHFELLVDQLAPPGAAAGSPPQSLVTVPVAVAGTTKSAGK